MNTAKKCRSCGVEKTCHSDNDKSDFYGRSKGINSSEKRFSPDCKICQKQKQNESNKKTREHQKANSDTGCPSAESLILRTIKWLEDNIGAPEDEYKKRTDNLVQLNSQINIEKKISTDQYMYFSKQDINYNAKDPITRENSIIFAVCVTVSEKMLTSIDTKDVYIFDRLDKIKIVIDKDIAITNELRMEIKTKLAN